jgi:hypothetical protein
MVFIFLLNLPFGFADMKQKIPKDQTTNNNGIDCVHKCTKKWMSGPEVRLSMSGTKAKNKIETILIVLSSHHCVESP